MSNLFEEGFTQNREISWLRYNERVLDEAMDESVPLFERLGFVSIFASNLLEFFQVRVGELITDDKLGDDELDVRSGMNAEEQLKAIYAMIPPLMKKKDYIYDYLDNKLADAGLARLSVDQMDQSEFVKAKIFYYETIKPKLKPILLDPNQEMPELESDKQYFACLLKSDRLYKVALIKFDDEIPAILVLQEGKSEKKPLRYVLTEDIIKAVLPVEFRPFAISELAVFSICKNNELPGDEPSGDMLKSMKKTIEERRHADPDMMMTDSKLYGPLMEFLLNKLELLPSQVYTTSRVSLRYIDELSDCIPPKLKDKLCYKDFEQFNQLSLRNDSVINLVRKEDILSFYPFESMDPFLNLLKESAVNPKVKEIRITIYRLASHPLIVDYLLEAVRNGKKVKVLMELRARFDEAKNIEWAKKLKEAGCNIYFGNEDYKVHAKLCQIVLKEKGEKRYITQVATGNYNEKTCSKYTDFSLITYDQRIGKDADEFFDSLFKGELCNCKHLLSAPTNMKATLIKYIRREAKKGRDGRIFFKCNSVTDEDIIEALMEASCVGCKIRMIVRGVCCILPGVELCTENIKVVNVVGRFLEHSRVYVFGSGADEVMYISSADLMKRNLDKRIEVACPIYNKNLRHRIKEIMSLNYHDNVKGRKLKSNGKYAMKKKLEPKINSQEILLDTICIDK